MKSNFFNSHSAQLSSKTVQVTHLNIYNVAREKLKTPLYF